MAPAARSDEEDRACAEKREERAQGAKAPRALVQDEAVGCLLDDAHGCE
jgi:hypothetical protein